MEAGRGRWRVDAVVVMDPIPKIDLKDFSKGFDCVMGGDSFDQRRAFAVLFLSLFVSMLGLGIISPLMSIFAESLGATGIWLGAIFSGFNISRAFIMPIVGRFSDLWGRRKAFLAFGMIFYCLASLGYVLTSEAFHLFLGRFIQGFGAGTVLPIAMAYVGDITPKGKEGTYTGFINVARTMGWGCGPLIGGVLMDTRGIEFPFLVMGALALGSLILILTALPEHDVGEIRFDSVSYSKILGARTLRGLVLYRGINAIGTANLFSFFPLLADAAGATPTEVGLLLSSRIIVMSVLQGAGGGLADRYDKVKLITISGGASSILLLLVPLFPSFLEMLILGLLIGCAWAVLMPATTALAAEYGREYGMASVMSTVNLGMSLGMIIGPILSGVVMDSINLHAVFYFGGLTAVFGTLLFYIITRNGGGYREKS